MQILLLIFLRTLARYSLEILMEAGKIIKATFIAKLFYAQLIFNQKFTGLTDAKFGKKLRVRFASA